MATHRAIVGRAAAVIFPVCATTLAVSADPSVSFPIGVMVLLWTGLSASAVAGLVVLVTDDARPSPLTRVQWWRYRARLRPKIGWEAYHYPRGRDELVGVRSISEPRSTAVAFLCEVYGPDGASVHDTLDRPSIFTGGRPGQLPQNPHEQFSAVFPTEFDAVNGWTLPHSGHLPKGTYHFLWFAYQHGGLIGEKAELHYLARGHFEVQQVRT